MDGIVILAVGLVLGLLLMWLWVSIRDYWKRSRDLRSASAKARKEVQEKALKARQDAQKARSAILDAGVRVLLLLVAIGATTWVVWMFMSL